MMLDPLLFPSSAHYSYLFTDPDELDLTNYSKLHPLEKALVSHAVDSRKAEFGDARWCAHQALREMNRDTGQPILRGDRGMPLWPSSVSGSLTHTKGLRAAVVAPRLLVRSMGLDAEPAEPLPPKIVESIAFGPELDCLEELSADFPFADRLMFCAKEATYKAWFPMTHRWLGFDEANLLLRADGTFTSVLLARPTPMPAIHGKWVCRHGYIIASTAVE